MDYKMEFNTYISFFVFKSLILHFTILFILTIGIKGISIHFNQTKPQIIEKDGHLKFEHVKRVCIERGSICKSGDQIVCATRILNGTSQYSDFENSCFLFMNNMCENFLNEFSIISSGKCCDYLKTRRNNPTPTNQGRTFRGLYKTSVSTKKALRTEYSTLYEVDTSFDYHTCPLSCPDVYSPVCINVNRGHGLYLKFLTFVNHCVADLYYCKHWREFSPPPGEEEQVLSSQLSWSLCAANRYIQFARFTEMTSSMGHYGWLVGDYRPTHIMEPHERMSGYG